MGMSGGTICQKNLIRWTCVGGVHTVMVARVNRVNCTFLSVTERAVNELFQKFWAVEELPECEFLTADESRAEQMVTSSMSVTEGRY